MSKPLVSTITPCYKMGKYLKLFLEELPKQSYFENLEIVLDHNEPTEEEIKLVKDFQQKYPGKIKHIIVNPVDPIGISMNRCIREASGELLTIWNVDDLRSTDSIENQVKMFENPEIGIAYGSFEIVNFFGSKKGEMVECCNIPKSELTRSMIIGPFFMFRKSLCEKAGYFDEQLKSGADFDFAIRLALNSSAACTDKPLGYYLDEGLGASTRPNSLQPIERTLIELRYAIYDKLDYMFLPQATKYNVPFILQNNKWCHISNYIDDYDNFMNDRIKEWFLVGLKKFFNAKFRIKIFNPIKKIHKVFSTIRKDNL